MLVLTRKIGEKIVIGDNVIVNVFGIEGGRVRLAIDAPRNVRILRAELTKVSNGSAVLGNDSGGVPGGSKLEPVKDQGLSEGSSAVLPTARSEDRAA